mgnify:CR=1 FL=1
MTGELFDVVSLWTKPLSKPAQVRNYIGEIAAQFAAAATSGVLLPIKQHTRVCPDIELHGLAGEIKSVGKNRRALLYQWRIAKEAEAYDPSRYLYLFVLHDCPITCGNVQEIAEHFGSNQITIHGCTLAELQVVVQDIPLRKFKMFNADLNPRIGYNRAGYIDGGWQFSTKLLPPAERNLVAECQWLERPVEVDLLLSSGWVKATTSLLP